MELPSIENFKVQAGPPSVTSIGMYSDSKEAKSAHNSFQLNKRRSSDLLGTSITSPFTSDVTSKALQTLPENTPDRKNAPEISENLESSDLNFIKKVRFDREKYFRLHFKIEKPEGALVEEALQHFEKRFESVATEGSTQARTHRERKSRGDRQGSVRGNSISIEGDQKSARMSHVKKTEVAQLIISHKTEGNEPRETRQGSGTAQIKRMPLVPKNTAKISVDESGDSDFLPRNNPRMTTGGTKNPYHFNKMEGDLLGGKCQVTRQSSMPAACHPLKENAMSLISPIDRQKEVMGENQGCFCQEMSRKFGLFELNVKQGVLEKILEQISAFSAKLDVIEARNRELIEENERLKLKTGVKTSRVTFFEQRNTLPAEKSEHLKFKKKSMATAMTARMAFPSNAVPSQLKKTSICGTKIR